MAIEQDLKGLVGFLKKNEKLVNDLKDAAGETKEVIERLVKRFERNRREIEALVESTGRTRFVVGKDAETRERQAVLLDEIAELTRKLELFRDDPLLKAHFLNLRASVFTALSRTYDDMAAKIVEFTEEEVEELHVLLARAQIDTENRMKIAFVVDAAIQLTKVAMRVATRIVAI